jgi:lipopolysaccharide export system permease protein
MRLLDRYILGEMVLPFLTGVFAVIMMLVGNTLFALVDLILKNNIPLIMVSRLVVFNIPTLVVLTLPVGVALAAALAVNRLARDSEVTSIRMAGVPLVRIFAPIFLAGLCASLLSFWLGERVVPAANREFSKTQSAMFGYAFASAPVLVSNKVFTYQNYSFFVRDASRGVKGNPNALLVHGVMIYEIPTSPNGFPTLITAESAIYDHQVWTLYHPAIHKLDSHGLVTGEATAAQGTLNLQAPLPILPNDQNTDMAGMPDAYNMGDLAKQIQLLSKTGQDATTLEVAYQFKMALPFLCFAFALCAPPLALRFARAGSFIGIFLSIVMVFVAWNTLLLTKSLGLSGHLSPFLAAWAPDLLFAALGIFFLWRME